MDRTPRLVGFTNDALGLATAGFGFAVYKMYTEAQITTGQSSSTDLPNYRLTTREFTQIKGKNRDHDYSTLAERLSGFPKGYSLKLKKIVCVHEFAGELFLLEFERVTVHSGFSTNKELHRWVKANMDSCFDQIKATYDSLNEVKYVCRRPSMLVLENINGSKELASNLGLLQDILMHLQSPNNILSMEMFEIVWKTETQTGVYEYTKFTEE